MRVSVRNVGVLLLAIMIGGSFVSTVRADRYSSSHYVIDASVVGNSFGGSQSSTSYKLTSSGGESIVGNGQGGSYKVGMGYVAQLDKSLTLSLQPSGLKAYYPLEENSGTFTRDSSINTSNADLQTGTTWTTGKIGNAVNTNASSYVQVPDSTNLTFSQNMTVSLWANQASASTDKALIAHWNQAVSSSWALQTGTSASVLRVFIANSQGDTGGNCVDTDGAWSAGSWHHVALVYDGTQSTALDRAKVYIDGVVRPMSVCLGTIPSSLQDSSWYLTIGAMRGLGRYFNGSLDEVKMFNRSLSADEVKAEYDAQAAGVSSGVTLGTITPGVSNNVLADAVVETDASSYTLAINQNNDLTSGSYTIPAISSGTIASPVAWNEGTTKGVGFSLTATNATAIPGSWGSGANYAAFPGTATTFYTRTGMPTAKDYVTLKIRADVSTTQVSTITPYSNIVTVTGTITP